ncbi:MAG: methyltransferase domain-containing protein [Cyanobacteria bacterium P01_H01_bin.35]
MLEKATKLIIKKHLEAGQIPWYPGYLVYRQQLISETLSNSDLISKFKLNQSLPSGYGYGVDERCVEYPWLFCQLNHNSESILDAGSALNHDFILEQPIWQNKKLHILTLSPEFNCHWKRGISYLFEDLRSIPIQDNFYDQIACISTLEHIGLDNRQFTGKDTDKQQKSKDFLLAIQEMRRVLKPCGSLLLTVPFGKYSNLETQQVFDDNLLEQAISAFKPSDITHTFFSYTQKGWQFSSVEQCKKCEYVDWIMLPEEKRPNKFPVQLDNAAAARAVACVKLVK